MPDKKIHIKGIPQEVTLRKNARIKRLSVKISSRSGVILCVPYGIPDILAIQFAKQQRSWILKHPAEEKYQKQEIRTQIHLANAEIHFTETEHNIYTIQRENNLFIVQLSKKLTFSEKEEEKLKALNKILWIAAREFLPQRVAELAKTHGFRYAKLSFRNQKTRWGSCSYYNNISLNIQLMRLPVHLIDYIIIHELSHTVHKNHSAKFWQLVHEKMGDMLYLCKKEMQKQKIEL